MESLLISWIPSLSSTSYEGYKPATEGQGAMAWAGGRLNKLCAHVLSTVHSDIQEVCGSSRIVTALLLKFARVSRGTIALLTS